MRILGAISPVSPCTCTAIHLFAPVKADEGKDISALNMPLSSGCTASAVVDCIVPPVAASYIEKFIVFGVVTGTPLGSVNLPSYPMICGIAPEHETENRTIKNIETHILLFMRTSRIINPSRLNYILDYTQIMSIKKLLVFPLSGTCSRG
jgi:hypothetical protein